MRAAATRRWVRCTRRRSSGASSLCGVQGRCSEPTGWACLLPGVHLFISATGVAMICPSLHRGSFVLHAREQSMVAMSANVAAILRQATILRRIYSFMMIQQRACERWLRPAWKIPAGKFPARKILLPVRPGSLRCSFHACWQPTFRPEGDQHCAQAARLRAVETGAFGRVHPVSHSRERVQMDVQRWEAERKNPRPKNFRAAPVHKNKKRETA